MLKHRFIATQQRCRHHSQSSETSSEDFIEIPNFRKQFKTRNNNQLLTSPASLSLSPNDGDGTTGKEGCSLSLSSFTSSAFIGCFGSNKSSPITFSSSFKQNNEKNFHKHNNNDNDNNTPIFNKCNNRHPRSCRNSNDALRRWNSFHSTHGECHPNRIKQNKKSLQVDHIKFRKLSTPTTRFFQDISSTNDNYNGCDLRSRFNKFSMQANSISISTEKCGSSSSGGGNSSPLKRGKSLIENNVTILKNVPSPTSSSW